jgi:glycolate oxidase FAD binding subunit
MEIATHTPTTQDEVLAIVAAAVTAQTPIIPWGGGTKQDYGYLPSKPSIAPSKPSIAPSKPSIVLNLSGLNQILSHEPDDMIVTVESGVVLADLQATLATKGQFLPLDPLYMAKSTVGGMLATNAFGLSALGYGTPRDWLIGIKVIDASGQWVKGGGKVVKNVTGYDLPKLHIGALGTLGIITEATFKVAPLPECEHTLLTRVEFTENDHAALTEIIAAVRAQTQPVRAILHSDQDGHYFVIGYAGMRESVTYEIERAQSILSLHLPDSPTGSFPEKLERQEVQSAFAVRLQSTPAQALEQHQLVCYETREVPGSVDTSLSGVTEVFWEAATDDILRAGDRLRDIAGRISAGFTVLHAPVAYRSRPLPNSEIWSPLPSAFPLMRRMKEQLDPHNLLNPGRFIGKL